MKRLLAVLAFIVCSTQAGAHDVGLSQSRWQLQGVELAGEIGLAPRELLALLPGADADGDGELTRPEFDASAAKLQLALLAGIELRRSGGTCAPARASLTLVAEDAATLHIRSDCGGDGEVSVALPLLARLTLDHRQLATLVLADGEHSLLLSGTRAGFALAPGADDESSWLAVLWLGAEHILFGLDHLAFLLGLLLARPALRNLLWTLTAFTLAHSLTLGLMAAGLVHAPGGLVEPLIGLSVAVVAIDNLRPRQVRVGTRWLLVLGVGLVHGFGFAGAIADQAPAGASLWPWLLAFNLGVECGQVAFALVAGALLASVRRLSLIAGPLHWAGNTTLMLIGLGWTVGRAWPG